MNDPQVKRAVLAVPDDFDFGTLKLSFEGDDITFDVEPIVAVLEGNGIDTAILHDEDNIASVICSLYVAHLSRGGDRHRVADTMISEPMIERILGQDFSLPPGHA